jgi:hypothetical protein
MPGYWQTLITGQVAGTAYANSTTANTPLQPGSATYTFPPNSFYIGKKLRVHATGVASCTASTPSLTLGFALGTIATPIIVFTSGAQALVPTTAKTNVNFELVINLTCRAIGSGTAANFVGGGYLLSEICVGSTVNAMGSMALPLAGPVVGTGFDATAFQTAQLVATWSAASASNSIQVQEYELSDLNFIP